MGEPTASRQQATWLGWIPLPALLLAYDGSAGGSPPTAGDPGDPLAQDHTRAALSAGLSAEMATAAVHRIFEAGLALEAAASLLPWPAVTLVLRVLDDLDQLVRDIRNAAVKPPARPVAPPRHEPELPPVHTVIRGIRSRPRMAGVSEDGDCHAS